MQVFEIIRVYFYFIYKNQKMLECVFVLAVIYMAYTLSLELCICLFDFTMPTVCALCESELKTTFTYKHTTVKTPLSYKPTTDSMYII